MHNYTAMSRCFIVLKIIASKALVLFAKHKKTMLYNFVLQRVQSFELHKCIISQNKSQFYIFLFFCVTIQWQNIFIYSVECNFFINTIMCFPSKKKSVNFEINILVISILWKYGEFCVSFLPYLKHNISINIFNLMVYESKYYAMNVR